MRPARAAAGPDRRLDARLRRPTPQPTNDPTATPGSDRDADPNGTPDPDATPAPTATATPAPTATPQPTPAPTADPGNGGSTGPSVGILVSRAEIAALPTTGAAWTNLKSWADAAAGTPDIQNQDEDNDIHVLAKALVYARTGIASYRAGVLTNLKAAVGIEAGGRTLALGRNLPGYVIAADLIDLTATTRPSTASTFRPWLRQLLTENRCGHDPHLDRREPPEQLGHACRGGSRRRSPATSATAPSWPGPPRSSTAGSAIAASYAGFSFGDTSWQCNPSAPVGINPKRLLRRAAIVLDGALPDDMRRGGVFQWPPTFTDYAWEAMQGATPRGGHPRPGRLSGLRLERPGDPSGRQLPVRPGELGARPATTSWQPWMLEPLLRD